MVSTHLNIDELVYESLPRQLARWALQIFHGFHILRWNVDLAMGTPGG
jgi:hypothetical protein